MRLFATGMTFALFIASLITDNNYESFCAAMMVMLYIELKGIDDA